MNNIKEKTILPITFDPIFTGIFNDENNIDIIENFLSVYLNIPKEKIKGRVKIKSRKLKSKAKKERRKEVDLVLDMEGEKINIELNSDYLGGIKNRNIVFISKIHGGQLKRSDNNYSKIKKTLQINLNTNQRNKHDLVEKYYYRNDYGEILSESVEIDVVDIEKAKKGEYNEREERLARWLRALTSTTLSGIEEELGDIMEKETQEKLIDEVEKYNEDEEIYELVSDYTKAELEKNTAIIEAREEARKEALEQRNIEIAKKLLLKNINVNDIAEITGLSIEEIEKLNRD